MLRHTLSLLLFLSFGSAISAEMPRSLKVASVQMRSVRDLDANVRHTIELLRACAQQGVQVAVFPECSVSGYFSDFIPQLTQEQIEAALRTIAQACGELHIAALVGSPVRQEHKLFNSAVVINARGQIIERYHKVQLAENWPVGGDHLAVFHLAGVPCSAIVCHDERYPELVRLPVLAGARVVFYLSHESGVRQERKLEPYRAQIQARAVENTVFIVHANAPANDDLSGSHGQSRLIAPDGNVLREATMFDEELLVGELDLSLATGSNARRSITRGSLIDWYEEGVKRVRIIP